MRGQAKFRARDKITQKMTRHGLMEQNQSTGQQQRISQRVQDVSFQQVNETQPMAGGRSRQPVSHTDTARRQTTRYSEPTGMPPETAPPPIPESPAPSAPFPAPDAVSSFIAGDWRDGKTSQPYTAGTEKVSAQPYSTIFAAEPLKENRARTPTDAPIRRTLRPAQYAAFVPTDWKGVDGIPGIPANPAEPQPVQPVPGSDETAPVQPIQTLLQDTGRYAFFEDSPNKAVFQEPPPRLHFDAAQRLSQTSTCGTAAPEPKRARRRLQLRAAKWLAPDLPPTAAGRTVDAPQRHSQTQTGQAAGAPQQRFHREPPAIQRTRLRFEQDAVSPESPTDAHAAPATGEPPNTSAPPETPASPTMQRLQSRSAQLQGKLDKAKAKLPSRVRLRVTREFDSETGKAQNRLHFESEPLRQPREPMVLTRFTRQAATAGLQAVHRKVAEAEQENVGVEAGHKTEQAAENAVRSTRRYVRHKDKVKFRRVARLEQKAAGNAAKLEYNRILQEHPELQKKPLSKFLQKRRIKRQYAKALRDAYKQGAKGTTAAAKSAASLAGKVGRWMVSLVRIHPAVVSGMIGFVLMVAMAAGMLSSCGALVTCGFASVFIPSYKAEDVDIEGSSLQWTEMEQELKERIANIEQEFPDFDEYRYQIGEIAHDPFEVISFLAAMYDDFIYTDVAGVLREIFNAVYDLQLVEEIEIRTRENEDGELEEYEWKILNVILEPKDFEEVVGPIMEEARKDDLYCAYKEALGGHQKYGNPFGYEWFDNITSLYGYRENPTGEGSQIHRGLDIAAPTGTPLYAVQDGKVIDAGNRGDWGNTVIVEDSQGRQTRFAHCSELYVSVGQKVKKGDKIAAVGSTGNSTGPHVHIEVRENGQYLNPIFMLEYTKQKEAANEP